MRMPFRFTLPPRWALALCALTLSFAPAFAAASLPMGLGGSESSSGSTAQEKALTEVRDAAAIAEAQAQVFEQRREALRAEAANAPARTAALEAELAVDARKSLATWRARLPRTTNIETLENALEQERVAVSQLRERIEAVTADLSRSLAQPAGPESSVADLQRRVDELAAPVVAVDGEATDFTEARRLRNAAERRRVAAELALRQDQQDLGGTRQRLQELELRSLRHELDLRTPRLALMQQRIATIGREELEKLAADVAGRAKAYAAQEPLVSAAAVENVRLADELVQTNERLASRRRFLAGQDEALARDLAGLRDSVSRVELGGRSEEVGNWLWAELRRLEPEAVLQDELGEVEQTLGELRLRMIALNELQRELADPAQAAQKLRSTAPGVDDDGLDVQAAEVDPLEDLLRERLDLTDRLEPLMWRRITALEQSERSVKARIEANRQLRQTLDRHLLWIRSHPPVDSAWLALLPAGLHDMVKPSRLVTTAELLQRSFAQSPWRYVASLALVLVLLGLQMRARVRIDALANVLREVHLRPTLQVLGWTVLAALPWAVALLLAGILLQGLGASGRYSDSLGQALAGVALPTFTLVFLRWLVRERGLAHAHFRWSRPRREALARWTPRLMVGLLPLYFIVALAFIRNQELAITVQARIALVLVSLVSAWATWRLLAPDQLMHRRGASIEPSRWRRVLRVGLSGGLLACAALALDGYVYSVGIVFGSMFASVSMIAAVTVGHGLLARWFVLGERRLAQRRHEQRLEAEAQAIADGSADAGDGGEAIAAEPEDEITLEKVNAQTRSLLRAIKLTALVIGLAWVWSGVMPAFARFDEFALWTITETGADGADVLVSVTLMAVMLGLLVLALTVVAARNLPGLIEIGLLSKVHMDAASRYAITSVSRYAIVLVGVVVGLGLLGLRWGQLQWMAAALTVGLGFGLQEIFANFVSGLILLFERPFRVGDVITVNNLDGTVTRIRTRATTLVDFDNKEIVVPNKTFITGQLVNWTLSDEATRITIKVGVDYGTDPHLVHRLLQQAAAENPRVLSERPPTSWLLNFGASTLEFELRLFVGTIADRLAVRNEINTRLIELFQENGIAFAYPQLDVHVRELPERAVPVAPVGERDAADPAATGRGRVREPGPD
ncbi:MAG: mechanosensitive ion channel [Arenimonas sp.]|uniref:mechanosensitive ion channel domain-containing protein n=1 Tax=Arenimonas sp. TaxID=1872635 RepID=UPI0025C17839|nr:mechanosensitive ion channel domain-containing protein [Arenimonas sp.]MBW8367455.1 mechanosensitive ion channel [Arenimonas sp.]